MDQQSTLFLTTQYHNVIIHIYETILIYKGDSMANSREAGNVKKFRTTVNLSSDARETLKALAYATDKSFTSIISSAIISYAKTKELEQEVKNLRHTILKLKTNIPESIIL